MRSVKEYFFGLKCGFTEVSGCSTWRLFRNCLLNKAEPAWALGNGLEEFVPWLHGELLALCLGNNSTPA